MLRLRSGRPSRLFVACALVAGALACCSAPSRAAVFTPGPRFSLATGTRPTGLAVADLDRDGVADLVTVNNTGATVSVLRGTGGGGFAPHVDYPAGALPISVAIGDLNDDLRLDVVVVNTGANTVTVLLGNGDGTLAAPNAFDTRTSPQCVALADFNRDGRLDVAVACAGVNTVSVHLGDGHGRLTGRTDYAVGTGPTFVAAGDLDGDGAPDLVATNRDAGTASVLLNLGDGRFGLPTHYGVGTRPAGVVISDVTRDGKPDVLVANNSSATLSLLPGAGYGLLGTRVDYATGATPIGVGTGDVDGNGTPDICVAMSGAGAIGVFPVSAGGVIGSRLDFAVGVTPRAAVVADLDGDGLSDLATVNNTGNTATLQCADLTSRFKSVREMRSHFASLRSAQVVVDIDGDGLLDHLTSAYTPGVEVTLGDGLGNFRWTVTAPTTLMLTSMAAGDLNHDRLIDVVGVTSSADSVFVLMNDGAGHLLAPVSYPLASGAQPQEVVVADANRDGHLDVLVASWGNNAIGLLAGNGNGTLATRVGYGVGGQPRSLAVTDLNADGRLDVVAGTESGTLAVLMGATTGFATRVDVASTGSLRALSAGDVNGDGKPDVVGQSNGPDSVFVSLNDGTGNLGTPRFLSRVGGHVTHVELVDLNVDGRLDLAWSEYLQDPTTLVDMSIVATMMGDGTGGFTSRHDADVDHADHVLAADVNVDGRPDLLVAPYGSVLTSMLLGLQPVRLTLTDAPAPTLAGGAFALTANVTPPWPAVIPPTGIVRFYRGESLLGQSRIANGVATWSVSDPGAGRHEFHATYTGDTVSTGAQSPPMVHRVLASAKPAIASIKDVTRDEGRQVRLRVSASPFDAPAVTTPIVRYDVLRRIDATLLLAARAAAVRTPAPGAAPASVAMEGWDVVGTFSATGDSVYHLVVPTVVDSNASGIHRATFFVRAITSTPTVYYDSPADSGWSLDNLPPPTPAPFTAAYVSGATRLHWGASGAADFAYYRLYRGASADFVPAPGSLIAARADTGWVDPGDAGAWYKLSAVDVNGNESVCAVLGPDGTVDTPSPAPGALRLRAASPNPARDATALRFTLPAATLATLAIFDASGRRVRTLASGERGAGEHALAWDLRDDAGRAVGAGLWFARLDAGGEHRVVRFATLR